MMYLKGNARVEFYGSNDGLLRTMGYRPLSEIEAENMKRVKREKLEEFKKTLCACGKTEARCVCVD